MRLVIIDQTLLPAEYKVLRLHRPEEIFEAIRSLRVRGAPAIGVAAAIGIAVCAAEFDESDRAVFDRRFAECRAYLASSRPTAVNLFWALERMQGVLTADPDADVCGIVELLCNEAEAIRGEDIAMSRSIGENGVRLFESLGMRRGERFTVLTHCNAGSLATVKYGTALAPVHLAKEAGFDIAVYADETRPLLQGARLTAFELTEDGIETTVICDNMAATVLGMGRDNVAFGKPCAAAGDGKTPLIDAVIVGADRIAANGDAANKIGTRGVAIIAKYYGVPFFVAAPSSTIDADTPDGAGIPIELRDGREISVMHYRQRMTPPAAREFNPAFDVTPASLISAIITERGVLYPPFSFAKE